MAVINSDVKALIDTARDTSPFIVTAQLIVTEELAGKGLSTERLDQVVLYLAAHFVCITEERGGLTRSKLGDADDTYKDPGISTQGLSSTRYGQQALILDNTGSLASMSAKNGLKARFTVIAQDMGACSVE